MCADRFSEAPPQILCENCAVQFLHNLCITFDAPAHVSHKFSGTSRDYPAYKFCTIFSETRGLFLKSASVQANNVSTLSSEPVAFSIASASIFNSSLEPHAHARPCLKTQDFQFLLQNPGPQKGFLKGFQKGSLKGFRRVSEGFQKGFRRVLS